MNKPARAEGPNPMKSLYDLDDGIAGITLNVAGAHEHDLGPDARCADTTADRGERGSRRASVMLTGNGRFFCAGLDLRGGGGRQRVQPGGPGPALDLRNTPPTVLHAMDKPTICALNGSAAGYGMDLALGCDIRIMANGEDGGGLLRRGVLPESGGTWILPRLIGWSKAAD